MNQSNFTDFLVKINWFNSKKYFSTAKSVKKQIIGLISEKLTDSDLERKEIFEDLMYLCTNSIFRSPNLIKQLS